MVTVSPTRMVVSTVPSHLVLPVTPVLISRYGSLGQTIGKEVINRLLNYVLELSIQRIQNLIRRFYPN
jgi:hypothetical protein